METTWASPGFRIDRSALGSLSAISSVHLDNVTGRCPQYVHLTHPKLLVAGEGAASVSLVSETKRDAGGLLGFYALPVLAVLTLCSLPCLPASLAAIRLALAWASGAAFLIHHVCTCISRTLHRSQELKCGTNESLKWDFGEKTHRLPLVGWIQMWMREGESVGPWDAWMLANAALAVLAALAASTPPCRLARPPRPPPRPRPLDLFWSTEAAKVGLTWGRLDGRAAM